MKCLICQRCSWNLICKACFENLKLYNTRSRVLEDGLKVYSFFPYEEISILLHSKYYIWGSGVLKRLAEATFGEFAKSFKFEELIYAVGIDDSIESGYSHTAILAKALESKSIKPLFSAIRAESKVSYSGKTLAFRKKNPRNFKVNLKKQVNIILVDDLVTTGETLIQANKALKKQGSNVLFALTLADAKIM